MKTNKLFNLASLLCALGIYKNSCAYDIGCIYPPQLGDNPVLTRVEWGEELLNVTTKTPNEFEMTQPFLARFGLYITGCTALCLAYHDTDVKDPYTQLPTFFTVPQFGQNAYSVTMCQAQCWHYVYQSFYDVRITMKNYFQMQGLNITESYERPDIRNAMQYYYDNDYTLGILEVLERDGYHPFTVGHVAGFDTIVRMRDDGFNEDGASMWCPTLEQEVPCVANCRQFQDTIGYHPQPDPRKHPFLSTDSNKYNCTGYCRRWQPQKDIGKPDGTSSRKDFALPHIGTKATTYLIDNTTLTLQDPEYDYYEESLHVVERLRQTSSDGMKKAIVELFRGEPNKGIHGLREPLETLTLGTFTSQIYFQDYVLQLFGMSLIEYDGIIQVWREKVYHDLVRPTTVIKQWADDVLDTFGGDLYSVGSQNINARDFETLLPPVESSAEFPSLHSCYCTTLMEFMDSFTSAMYGDTLQNFTVSVTYNSTDIFFQDMEDFRDKCGWSMLWGGYNFLDSISAGRTLCTGLGTTGVLYIEDLKNNSNYNGGWQLGDVLPTCP